MFRTTYVNDKCLELAQNENGGFNFLEPSDVLCFSDRQNNKMYKVPDLTDEELESILSIENPRTLIHQWEIVICDTDCIY